MEWIRYSSGIRKLKFDLAPRRNWPMQLILLIGPTGVGKSRAAAEWCEEQGKIAYWKDGTKWWDRYEGEEVVIWDEFYGHCCKFTDLLRITDRYPFQVETKGGYVEFTSKIIIFTSNQEPSDWYDGEKTHQPDWERNPLNRRIQEFGVTRYFTDSPVREPHPLYQDSDQLVVGGDEDLMARAMEVEREVREGEN